MQKIVDINKTQNGVGIPSGSRFSKLNKIATAKPERIDKHPARGFPDFKWIELIMVGSRQRSIVEDVTANFTI